MRAFDERIVAVMVAQDLGGIEVACAEYLMQQMARQTGAPWGAV
jgi:hypothetical protein